MSNITEKDKDLLESFHEDFSKDKNLQRSIQNYAEKHGLFLPDKILYVPGIDYVSVEIEGNPVFIVGLPPVSNYSIRETEYTDKYMRKKVA